jgi:hypothetical protein
MLRSTCDPKLEVVRDYTGTEYAAKSWSYHRCVVA